MEKLTPQSARPAAGTFLGVQTLRGLAACMVVVFHATQLWSLSAHGDGEAKAWDNGAAGVDLFFVISGFVMAVSTLGKGKGPRAAGTFMERRLVRIMPLYWLITAVLLIKTVAVYGLMAPQDGIQITVPYVLASLLLIPYRNSTGTVRAILLPAWTLYYEMFFYLCFAAALFVRRNVVRILSVTLVALAVVGCFYKDSWPGYLYVLNPLLLEFLAGLLLGRALQLGWRINKETAVVLGCVALVVLLVGPAPQTELTRRLVWGPLSFLILQAAVLWEGNLGARIPRWMLMIGDASYSLYLVHYSVIHLSARLLVRLHILTEHAGGLSNEMLVVTIYLASCVLLALVIHRWIERPMTDYLRRKLKLRRARIESARIAERLAA